MVASSHPSGDGQPGAAVPTGIRFAELLFQQAGVAGGALPAAFGEYPGVGKAADVLVGFSLVGAFGVIDADDYSGVAVHVGLHILNRQAGGLELRVFDIGEKLRLVANLAIPLGVDESGANQAIERARVAIHLGFVPQALHYQQLGLLRVVFGLLRSRVPQRKDS